MDYKELIDLSKKAATEWRGTHEYYHAATLITALCEATETLLAEREAAGWISVKDRTPKDDDDGLEFICMTSATGRCNGVMSLNWEVAKIRGKIVRRWMWRGRICPWEVTHWMPLPLTASRRRHGRRNPEPPGGGGFRAV